MKLAHELNVIDMKLAEVDIEKLKTETDRKPKFLKVRNQRHSKDYTNMLAVNTREN